MTIQNLSTFVEITRDLNLCVTAERLFTTQQSLSGHIKRLEKYYGVSLFDRVPGLKLTKHGESLLREAEKIIAADNRLHDEFSAVKREKAGHIKVVCGLERLRVYMARVLTEMKRRYPNIEISFINLAAPWGAPPITSGAVDFVISDKYDDGPGISSRFLTENCTCLAIADSLLREFLPDDTDRFIENALHGLDTTALPKDIPMVFIRREQNADEHWALDLLPDLNRFQKIFIDPVNNDLRLGLCLAGKAAVLISQLFYKHLIASGLSLNGDALYCFPLMKDGKLLDSPERIFFRSDAPLPAPYEDFIKITEEVFSNE